MALQLRRVMITRGHLNDLTTGLGQQMFFWGRDVLTDGNLLLKHGFQKHRSEGLQGTSCYCKPWQDGMIELHGACAGWYPCEGRKCGFLFIRNAKRCYVHHRSTPVVPGEYDFREFDSSNLTELTRSSRIFTAWLAEYEAWIAEQMGRAYREECHAMFCKLPSSRSWLEPEKASRWVCHFRRRFEHFAPCEGLGGGLRVALAQTSSKRRKRRPAMALCAAKISLHSCLQS